MQCSYSKAAAGKGNVQFLGLWVSCAAFEVAGACRTYFDTRPKPTFAALQNRVIQRQVQAHNESLYVLTRRILRCAPTTQTGQTTPSRVELQKRELVFLSPLPSLLRDPLVLDRLLAASSWIRR